MIGAIAASYVASSYSAEILSGSPAAYYRMGDASGTVCADSSGNGRHATYNNSPTLGVPGLLTGDSDTAVEFVGNNQWSVISTADWMNPTSGSPYLSMSALIKADSFGITRGILARGGGGSNGNRNWRFYTDASGVLMFAYYNSSNVITTVTSTGAALTTGVEYHVGVKADGTNITFYVNGVVDSVVTQAFLPKVQGHVTATGSLIIGILNNLGTGAVQPLTSFDGIIDEVAYFPAQALSDAQFAAQYAAA